MPSIANVLKKFTNQRMLYWQSTGLPDDKGQPSYINPIPVVVNVRWEDKVQEVLTDKGRRVHATAYILVATFLVPGSWVYLAKTRSVIAAVALAEWQGGPSGVPPPMPGYPARPTFNQGGREILVCKTTPDIKNTSTIYEAYV